MRPFLRILLNVGSDLSLLLFVLVIALWARSYRGGDRIGRTSLAGEWGSPYLRPARMASSVPDPPSPARAPDEPDYSPVRIGSDGTLERDGLVSSSGRLYVERESYHVGAPDYAIERVAEGLGWYWRPAFGAVFFVHLQAVIRDSRRELAGFFVSSEEVAGGATTQRVRQVGVPHWAVAVVAAVLPIARALRYRHRRRRGRLGLCRACGYDLRATPDRCPECGQKPRPTHVD